MIWEDLIRQVNDKKFIVGQFNQSGFEGTKILEFKTTAKVVLTSGIWKYVKRELEKKNVAVKTEISDDAFKVMVILPPSLDWQTKKREIVSLISWAFLKFIEKEVEDIVEGYVSSDEIKKMPEVIKKEPKSRW